MRERAVQLVFEQENGHESQWSAISSISGKIGCTAEKPRKWVHQIERDQGRREKMTSTEREQLLVTVDALSRYLGHSNVAFTLNLFCHNELSEDDLMDYIAEMSALRREHVRRIINVKKVFFLLLFVAPCLFAENDSGWMQNFLGVWQLQYVGSVSMTATSGDGKLIMNSILMMLPEPDENDQIEFLKGGFGHHSEKYLAAPDSFAETTRPFIWAEETRNEISLRFSGDAFPK